jgi:hypothetical protein
MSALFVATARLPSVQRAPVPLSLKRTVSGETSSAYSMSDWSMTFDSKATAFAVGAYQKTAMFRSPTLSRSHGRSEKLSSG